eukprot:TRINITY_DN8262_c0_g1_i3.p1 TRINITY_DN8262_c0_g1~~TRINITY_DN8262_c0_g1_i3.p1  ORF type:complete len:1424 (+),score=510.34 TRINITY_DN8262_c0_g1_i3:184-4272(+)
MQVLRSKLKATQRKLKSKKESEIDVKAGLERKSSLSSSEEAAIETPTPPAEVNDVASLLEISARGLHTMRREDVHAMCSTYGIAFDENDTQKVLKGKLKAKKIELEQAAAADVESEIDVKAELERKSSLSSSEEEATVKVERVDAADLLEMTTRALTLMRKQDVQAMCTTYGIAFDENDTLKALQGKLKAKKIELEQAAAADVESEIELERKSSLSSSEEVERVDAADLLEMTTRALTLMRKQDVQAMCTTYGIAFDENDTLKALQGKLKAKKIELEQAAAACAATSDVRDADNRSSVMAESVNCELAGAVNLLEVSAGLLEVLNLHEMRATCSKYGISFGGMDSPKILAAKLRVKKDELEAKLEAAIETATPVAEVNDVASLLEISARGLHSMQREDVHALCSTYGIAFDENDTQKVLKGKLKALKGKLKAKKINLEQAAAAGAESEDGTEVEAEPDMQVKGRKRKRTDNDQSDNDTKRQRSLSEAASEEDAAVNGTSIDAVDLLKLSFADIHKLSKEELFTTCTTYSIAFRKKDAVRELRGKLKAKKIELEQAAASGAESEDGTEVEAEPDMQVKGRKRKRTDNDQSDNDTKRQRSLSEAASEEDAAVNGTSIDAVDLLKLSFADIHKLSKEELFTTCTTYSIAFRKKDAVRELRGKLKAKKIELEQAAASGAGSEDRVEVKKEPDVQEKARKRKRTDDGQGVNAKRLKLKAKKEELKGAVDLLEVTVKAMRSLTREEVRATCGKYGIAFGEKDALNTLRGKLKAKKIELEQAGAAGAESEDEKEGKSSAGPAEAKPGPAMRCKVYHRLGGVESDWDILGQGEASISTADDGVQQIVALDAAGQQLVAQDVQTAQDACQQGLLVLFSDASNFLDFGLSFETQEMGDQMWQLFQSALGESKKAPRKRAAAKVKQKVKQKAEKAPKKAPPKRAAAKVKQKVKQKLELGFMDGEAQKAPKKAPPKRAAAKTKPVVQVKQKVEEEEVESEATTDEEFPTGAVINLLSMPPKKVKEEVKKPRRRRTQAAAFFTAAPEKSALLEDWAKPEEGARKAKARKPIERWTLPRLFVEVKEEVKEDEGKEVKEEPGDAWGGEDWGANEGAGDGVTDEVKDEIRDPGDAGAAGMSNASPTPLDAPSDASSDDRVLDRAVPHHNPKRLPSARLRALASEYGVDYWTPGTTQKRPAVLKALWTAQREAEFAKHLRREADEATDPTERGAAPLREPLVVQHGQSQYFDTAGAGAPCASVGDFCAWLAHPAHIAEHHLAFPEELAAAVVPTAPAAAASCPPATAADAATPAGLNQSLQGLIPAMFSGEPLQLTALQRVLLRRVLLRILHAAAAAARHDGDREAAGGCIQTETKDDY